MRNIVLFGASKFGSLVYAKLKNEKNIIYFADNDSNKWGKLYEGIEVINPIKVKDFKNVQIIISSSYDLQIAEQLIAMGIKRFKIAKLLHNINSNNEEDELELIDCNFEMSGALTENKKITLIVMNASGSNTIALYKLMPEYIKKKYKMNLIKDYKKDIYFYKTLLMSNLLIGTEGPVNHIENSLNIELWHGFPLKGIGNMSKEDKVNMPFISEQWNNLDAIISYSEFYNIFMSSAFWIEKEKFLITGMPRNDFLYKSDGKKQILNLLNLNMNDKKVLFYLPTFRKSVHQKNMTKIWDNIFGMADFNLEQFNSFLNKYNLHLIVKLHPNEENYVISKLQQMKVNNITLLKNEVLNNSVVDLYEILNAADLLITDYSSVYFDFLLLNRPIIFTPTDLEIYRKTRGFMLEPYGLWTPGPKVLKQEELEGEIIKLLTDTKYYQKERQYIRDIIHRYKDGNSSERVWKVIDKIMVV